MIVTSGASHCQSKKRGAGGVDHSVQFVLSLHQREVDILALDEIVWSCDEETGANAAAKGIPGQLLAHELVVRQVVVEGVHHPVTVWPGIRAFPVGLETVCFGVANNIQPMLRPALTEPRIFQHPVDQSFPGVRRRVILKCRNFPRGRVHSQHDEVESADEHLSLGQAGWRKVRLCELGEYK